MIVAIENFYQIRFQPNKIVRTVNSPADPDEMYINIELLTECFGNVKCADRLKQLIYSLPPRPSRLM